MAQAMFDVECPCCKAVLKIDPETRAVIAHTVPVKPPPIEDLAAEVAKLKGEGARREQVFQKNFEAERNHGKVLEKKFDELFKRAKENPDLTPRNAISIWIKSVTGQEAYPTSRFSAKPHSSSIHCPPSLN